MLYIVQTISHYGKEMYAVNRHHTRDYREALSLCRQIKIDENFSARVVCSDKRGTFVLFLNSEHGRTFPPYRNAPRGAVLAEFIKAFDVRTLAQAVALRDFIPASVAPLPGWKKAPRSDLVTFC